jgi:hypothetical protein
MRANILAGTIGVCMAVGAGQSARAEFTFRNDTAEPIVFNLQCRDASLETLSIAPNRSQAYRCANGARDALLEVYTADDDEADDDGDDLLVSDQVHDTEIYAFFRDAVGYVEVVRFR